MSIFHLIPNSTKTLVKDFLAWDSKNFPLNHLLKKGRKRGLCVLGEDSKGGYITTCFYLLKFVFIIAESYGMLELASSIKHINQPS